MYFLKVVSSFILLMILIDGFTDASVETLAKDLNEKIRKLQLEIEDELKKSQQNCSSPILNEKEYEKVVSDFLKLNVTFPGGQKAANQNQTGSTPEKKSESFLGKLKKKIFSFVRGNKNDSQPEARLKRCMGVDDGSMMDVTVEEENLKLDSSNVEDFKFFMKNLVDCLGKVNKSEDKEAEDKLPDENASVTSTTATTATPPQNNSKINNLLRYLTQSKHSVQDTGRAGYKSPNLMQIQNIVDQIKSFDFFDLDETTVDPTTCNGVDENISANQVSVDEIGKRSSRNVFDDFTGKIKEMVVGPRNVRKERREKLTEKRKRKLNGLFTDIDMTDREMKVKAPEKEEVVAPEAVQVNQPSEDEKLRKDWNVFQSKLNPEQQVDISDFLDHVKDKPQAFKFDTTPFLLQQLEKLNHPEQNENQQEDDEPLSGAKKFFEFNAPVKRSLFMDRVEDFPKIAKLKSKLIQEYRGHHPIIDYAGILRQIDVDNQQRSEKGDDFLDHYYRLNDGSARVQDVFRPYHADTRVLSPYELNLNFQLENEFKELDPINDAREEPKSNPLDVELPLYKPEVDDDADFTNDLP